MSMERVRVPIAFSLVCQTETERECARGRETESESADLGWPSTPQAWLHEHPQSGLNRHQPQQTGRADALAGPGLLDHRSPAPAGKPWNRSCDCRRRKTPL
ncbi:hypothetical protein ElyMa_001043500 [Elysia marginata]|uniref:Uncharacterized protein n=1 Tax=Elysia marginata TaxID=1093978 RepID=A0AAV4HRU5_9GAST|nr:hypothetical protein ElyMa_001043500 [Elysia marginata]